MTINVKKLVLPNLPYLFIFWFFTKVAQSYRIAVGDTITKAMGALSGLGEVMKNPLPSFYPQDLLVGVVGGAAIWLIRPLRKLSID